MLQRFEPPSADPHARWCGRGPGKPGPYADANVPTEPERLEVRERLAIIRLSERMFGLSQHCVVKWTPIFGPAVGLSGQHVQLGNKNIGRNLDVQVSMDNCCFPGRVGNILRARSISYLSYSLGNNKRYFQKTGSFAGKTTSPGERLPSLREPIK